MPAEQPRSHCSRCDDLKGALLASGCREDARHLRVRCAVGRLSDLVREIIVWSFDRWPACRSCCNALTQDRVGFPSAFKNPSFQRACKRIVIGSTGRQRLSLVV